MHGDGKSYSRFSYAETGICLPVQKHTARIFVVKAYLKDSRVRRHRQKKEGHFQLKLNNMLVKKGELKV